MDDIVVVDTGSTDRTKEVAARFGARVFAPGSRGLGPALEEFLALGTFQLLERHRNNNGLTVLEALRPTTTKRRFFSHISNSKGRVNSHVR